MTLETLDKFHLTCGAVWLCRFQVQMMSSVCQNQIKAWPVLQAHVWKQESRTVKEPGRLNHILHTEKHTQAVAVCRKIKTSYWIRKISNLFFCSAHFTFSEVVKGKRLTSRPHPCAPLLKIRYVKCEFFAEVIHVMRTRILTVHI